MTSLSDTTPSSVEEADTTTQLAVDLIYLLEINHIDPTVALAALKIVETDCLRKQVEK